MTPTVRKIGLATLYLGDCRDIAPSLERPAAIVTDPPYGMGWNTDTTRFSGGNHRRGQGRADFGDIIADDAPFDPAPWIAAADRVVLWGANHFAARLPVGTTLVWVKKAEHLYGTFLSDAEVAWCSGGHIIADDAPFDPAPWIAAADRVVLWGANHFAARLPVGTTLVWVKKAEHLYGTFLSDAEVAWCSGGHGVYCCSIPWSPPARAVDAGGDPCRPRSIHPTQKPVALMRWCIEKAKVEPGGVVLDPYMGSGSTGVAAVSAGHPFVGIELVPAYFEIACRRIAEAQKQATLFAEAAE